jgi:membrane protein DedA with SNARE-associated domain
MIENFIEQFTYLGIFLVLFAAGVGMPVPEEVPVIASAVLAHEAVVRWWLALPVCIAGVLSGDIALYWAGYHWGEHVLDWRIVRLVLTKAREEALKSSYHRHGVKIVFTARHIVGLRAAAFLTAGIVRLPFLQFLAVDAAGAMVSVPLAFGLGYLFTDQLAAALAGVHRVERWIGLAILVGIVGWIAIVFWRRNRAARSGRAL